MRTGFGAGFPVGLFLGPALAAAAAVATGIQIAAIKQSKPTPPQLAEGAEVLPTPGGTNVIMAEAGVSEFAIPDRSDVMARIADRISANMRPQENIFQPQNNINFPSEMILNVDGQGIRAFVVNGVRNGQIPISPRGIAAR